MHFYTNMTQSKKEVFRMIFKYKKRIFQDNKNHSTYWKPFFAMHIQVVYLNIRDVVFTTSWICKQPVCIQLVCFCIPSQNGNVLSWEIHEMVFLICIILYSNGIIHTQKYMHLRNNLKCLKCNVKLYEDKLIFFIGNIDFL